MDGRDETRASVIDDLIGDHNRLKSYFAQYKEANDHTDKQAYAELAMNALAIHAVIEEEIVYPWIKVKKPYIANLIDRLFEQHNIVEKLALQLLTREFDEQYDRDFVQVIESITQHIQLEEKEIFVQLDDLDLGSLAPMIQKWRDDLQREEIAGNRKVWTTDSLLFRNEDNKRRSA